MRNSAESEVRVDPTHRIEPVPNLALTIKKSQVRLTVAEGLGEELTKCALGKFRRSTTAFTSVA